MALAFEKKKKLHYGRDVAGVYRGDHGFKSSSSKFPIYCWMFALILKNATLYLHDQGKALPRAALPSQITHPTAGTQSWEQSSPKHLCREGELWWGWTQQDTAKMGARTSILDLQSFWEERTPGNGFIKNTYLPLRLRRLNIKIS